MLSIITFVCFKIRLYIVWRKGRCVGRWLILRWAYVLWIYLLWYIQFFTHFGSRLGFINLLLILDFGCAFIPNGNLGLLLAPHRRGLKVIFLFFLLLFLFVGFLITYINHLDLKIWLLIHWRLWDASRVFCQAFYVDRASLGNHWRLFTTFVASHL